MTRTTNKELDSLFRIWQNAIGVDDATITQPVWATNPQGRLVARVGAYLWDIAYGGMRVSRICSESGGQEDISPRLTKSQMAAWLRAGIETMRQYRSLTAEESAPHCPRRHPSPALTPRGIQTGRQPESLAPQGVTTMEPKALTYAKDDAIAEIRTRDHQLCPTSETSLLGDALWDLRQAKTTFDLASALDWWHACYDAYADVMDDPSKAEAFLDQLQNGQLDF